MLKLAYVVHTLAIVLPVEFVLKQVRFAGEEKEVEVELERVELESAEQEHLYKLF
jgi:hypothetical protein